ncbi:hypothetical protein OKW35_000301 [Paraburkholderia sp. MM5477-R1]
MELPDILHNRRAPIAPCGTEADFLSGVTREDIRQTSRALGKNIVRTPLLPHTAPGNDRSIFLKPENLQPRGSFKVHRSSMRFPTLRPLSYRRDVHGKHWEFRTGLDAGGACTPGRREGLCHENRLAKQNCGASRVGCESRRNQFRKMWAILCGEKPVDENGTFLHPCSGRDVIAATQPSGRKFLKIYQTWMQFWCLSAAEDWSWASRWRARVGVLSRMCTHAGPKLRRRCVPLWQQAALSRCLSTPIPSSRALGFRLYWNQIGPSSTRWWTASLYRRSTQLPIAFVS